MPRAMLRGLKTVRIEWYTDEASGQQKFREVAGHEQEWPCQLALLAMGFVGPEKQGPIADLGLELDPRGNVKTGSRLHDQPGGRVRRGRHAARPVARGVGDPRGPRGGTGGRPLADGPDQPPEPRRRRVRRARGHVLTGSYGAG
jgi:NADPH-dependent glutamate synthase beta subunit-like oxidoreductase